MVSQQTKQGGTPLKQIRLALGLTQTEFASLLGTSDTTVGRRERGDHDPALSVEEIVKIDEALAVIGLRWRDFAPKNAQSA